MRARTSWEPGSLWGSEFGGGGWKGNWILMYGIGTSLILVSIERPVTRTVFIPWAL